MKLKDLKDYVMSLPERLDDFEVVNGELTSSEDGLTYVLVNNSVYTTYVDEKTKEIQFLHQSDEDIRNLILNKTNGNT